MFQIPCHQLAEGDECGRDDSEQRNHHRHREKHSAPACGRGRHSPNLDFRAATQQLRQGGHRTAQRRALQNYREEQERSDHRAQLDPPPTEITTEPEAEKASHQNEVLEVGKDSDFRRYPTDHQHFHEQAEKADEHELAIAETAESFDGNLPAAQRRRHALQALEDAMNNQYGDGGDQEEKREREWRMADRLHWKGLASSQTRKTSG